MQIFYKKKKKIPHSIPREGDVCEKKDGYLFLSQRFGQDVGTIT